MYFIIYRRYNNSVEKLFIVTHIGVLRGKYVQSKQ